MSSSSYVGGVSGGPARDYSSFFVLPASSSQRQLWFLCQLDEGANAAYNVVSAVRLTGRLDHVLLQRALNEVVARHESLRTGIGLVDGEARQVVVPSTLVSLPVVEGDVQELAAEQAAIPFTLDEPPLLRVVLVREAPDVHTLIVVIHHIACDGWSTEVFYRDLAQAYQQVSLPEPSIQYADYVAWQEETLVGEPMRDLVTHWRSALSGITPLNLPIDRPRTTQRKTGGRIEVPLPGIDVTRWDATRFMVLLAAFKVTLARVCGTADVAVGTPVAGRHHPDAEDLIGFFANTLVLRTRLPLDESFDAAVSAVRDTCLAAFSHQRMPFDRLVEEMRLPRVLDRNPLFDVMFSVQDKPAVAVELPSLTMAPVELVTTSAKFDLWLTVLPDRIRLDYDADLYDEQTARRILSLYLAVLRSPDGVCAGLPKASDDDLAQLSYWAEGPSVPVPELVVPAEAKELAQLLRDEGIGTGVVVSTPPEASPELVVIAHAVLAVGGTLAYGRRHTRDGAFVKHNGDWVITTGPRFDPVDDATPDLRDVTVPIRDRLGIKPDDDVVLLADPGVGPDLADLLLCTEISRGEAPENAWILGAPQTFRRLITEGWTPPVGAKLVCRGEVVADDVVRMLRRTGREVFVGHNANGTPISLEPGGAPLANTTRELRDATGEPAPIGTVGELYLSGAPTGQRHRYTSAGELEFVGYVDERLAVGDHLVVPSRIEAALESVEGVRSAAVVAGNVGAETRLVGWLVLDGAKAAASPREQDEFVTAVKAKATQTLQPHEIPVAFGVLPELPEHRTALAALPAEALLGKVDDTPPRNRIERVVVSIFKDTLPVREFGVHADFFALGGHSMLAAKVIGRVRDQLGVLVPIRDFFQRSTAAGLAEAVAALENQDKPKDKVTALRGQLDGMTDKEIEQLLRQLG
ncbi:hypothetical protein Lesp02_37110 [Lentzea sp. NBRC 105346]|uniref:condensation domain-containing protein n=1 Tax=Lentzea sp. NBRC 105346 TaxID=3032205 RepID=UPI0024A5E4CA|nr:condensation domain-containing protein [Lentzea sp. NBRC 105346]GLZ31523.1 hypothetical protein Lesp02_37110 [Lentzea sp. NBRC 105346]